MSSTLLIVDASATTRAMIKRIAGSCGIDKAGIIEAADGPEALDALDTNDCDLVLTDLHLPGMGGLELVQALQADPTLRHVPVVVVSADLNPTQVAELKREGVRGCLARPFTPESFRDVLGQL